MPDLFHLMLKLKGGAGSGNFGHSGRPGKRGGSTSKGGSLPPNPTSLEFSNYKLWEDQIGKTSKPPFFRLDQLPPVPEGYKRIYHGTASDNIQSIDKVGLVPGSEVDKKEKLRNILGTTQEPSSFGEISVVVDLPLNKFRHVNSDWVEFNRVDPKDITGYYVSKIDADIRQLIPIYDEYDKLYGG